MLRSDDLLGIGMEADSVRKRLHPGNVVTYQIDRNVQLHQHLHRYCSFCAFYRPVGSPEGYIQPLDSMLQKNRGNHCLGRHGRADAGRVAS